MPCNLHLRALAETVKRRRPRGGRHARCEFNTIAVSDGIAMGTDGMRASLVSREVIADSIELVALGHLVDGVVALTGCDKTIPARGDGAGAARCARRCCSTAGRSRPGRFAGSRRHHPGRVRGGRRLRRRQDERAELCELEDAACPGAGACGGQFTANTMAMALTLLGLSPIGANERAGDRSARSATVARRAARW